MEDAATENVEVVLGVWKGRGESSKAGARRGKVKVGAGEGQGRCGGRTRSVRGKDKVGAAEDLDGRSQVLSQNDVGAGGGSEDGGTEFNANWMGVSDAQMWHRGAHVLLA